MNKKSWFRLLFVQHLNEFKEKVSTIIADKQINNLIGKIAKVEKPVAITLPETFELLLYSNIDLEVAPETTEVELTIESYTIKWDKFKEELEEQFCGIINPNDLAAEKEKTTLSFLKAELVTLLLQKAFTLIDHYFPFKEYGLPSMYFLETLMNLLTDNDFAVEVKPDIFKTFDPYGLILKKENEYLRKLLMEKGVNSDKKMIEDGFAFKQQLFEENLKKNPLHLIRVEPKTKQQHLKDEANRLAIQMEAVEAEAYPEIKEYSKQFKTIENHTDFYVDKRYNQKMSIREIVDTIYLEQLQKDSDEFNKNYNQVAREIKQMADICGFGCLEEKIKKYNPYIPETSKIKKLLISIFKNKK